MAPRFSRGPLTTSPPPARPGSEGRWGCASRAPGSARCLRALSCLRRRVLAGCSPGADAPGTRWASSLPQDARARKSLPGAAPSPLCFSQIRGSDRLFYRDWSRGLGRARSPGMRCVPRSPPRLCLSPVIFVLGRLPQIARQGGHREGQNVSLERGRDSASATWYQLSPVRRKRNCSLTANSGRAGGSEKGRDPQIEVNLKKIVKVKIINTPGVL